MQTRPWQGLSAAARAQGAFTTKDGGMGIGLSVSRTIVESHNGRLWASRNDGPGASFAFSIPCADVATEPMSQSCSHAGQMSDANI